MLESVMEVVTSPALVALALEGDCSPFRSPRVRDQVVAGLARRCPALRAVRLDRLFVSGHLMELTSLEHLQGLLVTCTVWPLGPLLDRHIVGLECYDCYGEEPWD